MKIIAVLLAIVTIALVGFAQLFVAPTHSGKDRATSFSLPHGFNSIGDLIQFHRDNFGAAVAVLWTDIIEPATLTGYARAAMEDYEQKKGTLARWLPYNLIRGIDARFIKGATGLLEISKFRAFDAAPGVGAQPGGQRVTIELPALGETLPVSEYERLKAQGVQLTDEVIVKLVEDKTRKQVQKFVDALEWMRGVVLNTGIATIAQDNFKSADDFGRSGSHSVVAGTLWSVTATADPLADLTSWSDTYIADNGEAPGAILMSTAAARAMAKTKPFALQLLNGASRQATLQDVNDILEGESLPPIVRYDRQVKRNGANTKVWPANKIALLPAPVDPNDEAGTELGATFLGTTLTSQEDDWALEQSEQPGLVAGLWKDDKPPNKAEVITDGIGLPVLANADLSFVAQVLT